MPSHIDISTVPLEQHMKLAEEWRSKGKPGPYLGPGKGP